MNVVTKYATAMRCVMKHKCQPDDLVVGSLLGDMLV
jgi:hypothetical protein